MSQSKNTAIAYSAQSQSRAGLISIRFVLRDPNRLETSLQCRIGINGEYATEFVVERNIKTANWAQSLQKMLDDSPESKLLNEKLAFIKIEIKRAELRLRLEGKKVTANALKEAYLETQGHIKAPIKAEQAKPERPTFQDCFFAFYNRKATNKRQVICDRTKETYWNYRKNFEKYVAGQKIKCLYADQITNQWAEKYFDWLKERFVNNYANKNIQLLKSVLQFAYDTDLISTNPIKGFKLYDDGQYDTTHLTLEQVMTMANFDFSSLPITPEAAESLRHEADCFVFTCFTAQHHSDLHRRKFELYTSSKDGRIWMRDKRVKTGSPYMLPVHPVAMAVIEKYGGIDKLPVKANPRRNLKLKEIAVFCGIDKHLTTKIGRKTFANYALNTQRMREETVAAILGHKSTKYIRHYARITEESIAAEYKF